MQPTQQQAQESGERLIGQHQSPYQQNKPNSEVNADNELPTHPYDSENKGLTPREALASCGRPIARRDAKRDQKWSGDTYERSTAIDIRSSTGLTTD
ncbi:MAG: hypothetical protein AAGE99_05980 [Chlamydiota bacterium]